MRCRVVAVDVGSVRANFAWAGLDLPGRDPVGSGGTHPEGAAQAVLEAIAQGVPVGLGFEAPLMVPVSPIGPVEEWMTLGKARRGENVGGRARPWSAGAGSGALATGLVQLAWILDRIAHSVPGLGATTGPQTWLSGRVPLLVWEAFVSGEGKPVPAGITQHAADAAAAADTFADRHEQGRLEDSDVRCHPESAFNLAAAAAAYAGLTISTSELRAEVPVYRTRPGAVLG